MAHFFATVLIGVELALRSRKLARATSRVDRELVSRKNLGVPSFIDGNFRISVVYKVALRSRYGYGHHDADRRDR